MTDYQPVPNPDISGSLPLPPPAHRNSGSGDITIPLQAGAAPISPPGRAATVPHAHGLPSADQGSGNAYAAKRSTSIVSTTSTLSRAAGYGKSLDERTTPILRAAEEALDRSLKAVRMHKRVLDAISGVLVVSGMLTIVLGTATMGQSASFVTAIFGAISTITAFYLCHRLGSGEPVISSLRAHELRAFILDLQYFVVNHRHVTVATPETEAKITEYEQRSRVVVEGNGWAVRSALKAEDSRRIWGADIVAEKGEMEKSTV